jgi:Vacuolar protein sorting-associated protein 62
VLTAAAVAAALATFAPVVVHDSGERSPLTAVGSASVDAPGRGADRHPTAYARAAPVGDSGVWLQYWLFYARQDQDRGILRTGRHTGDWEMVQYRLDAAGRPTEAVYAQHAGAERGPWRAVELRDGHPVVYVARGSHASYFRAGVRDRMWPDPNDEADGRGRVARPRLVRLTSTTPPWIRWPGRWGGARARWWVPGEQDSPRGPAFQPERWRDPADWAARAHDYRPECHVVDACDGREVTLGRAGIGTSTAVLALAWLHRARRRRAADFPRHKPR